GTYADYGVVPDGNVRVVRAAREAGHRVLLCTGRPVSMLPQSILAAGFDGLVASAGAYAEVAGEVLVDRRFPADLAARTVAALDAHDAVYILEAQEALHVPPAAAERLRAILDAHFRQAPGGPVGSSAILGAVQPTADRAAVSFAKVSVFDSPVAMEDLVREIGEDIAVVANSVADEGRHAGELFQRGISKADGVAAVIAHLGIAREDTIAIGDGANDLEMIAYAGIGVAIEGSIPELIAIADRTAGRPRQEGLVAAFAELGLH
ncbi:MAG TPA: HAD family hydrolase, partial [Arthrobacter sp.]